ncbi:Cro/Cl family transcriptional regulator [Acinetobacter sp. VNH17]|uniref:Cro/Cl family transcriptional regulator n=1 Tax=Acinetobacter thutiue TaxID=2998078 RepID=A0ABT7WN43_9GAMM|nr:Cro/Cl family transcriptional regulator [Acinetobacter thutiue]MCY6411968.1 Cro/Cl family transcriptional regulator [Acinetobacter thutiue]MDN0014072.1 Cro/Cl family transcriptional regulator [Acinetobacter thutiue]
MSIGLRLKEERERLGFTQPVFAGLAATTKKSQIDYEKDLTQPKAGYLSVIADVGADVQYIITGERSANALSTDENLILEKYRKASPDIKNKMLMLLLSGETTNSVVNSPVNSGKGNQYNGTNQTINNAAPAKSKDINGDVSIKAKGKRAQAAFNIKNE